MTSSLFLIGCLYWDGDPSVPTKDQPVLLIDCVILPTFMLLNIHSSYLITKCPLRNLCGKQEEVEIARSFVWIQRVSEMGISETSSWCCATSDKSSDPPAECGLWYLERGSHKGINLPCKAKAGRQSGCRFPTSGYVSDSIPERSGLCRNLVGNHLWLESHR